jgi:hypothetical protein
LTKITLTTIESRALTSCNVTPDGQRIALGFVDTAGQLSAIHLPIDQAGSLAMTLPALIERALRVSFRDETLRYTYPLGSWKFEHAHNQSQGIVTLSTTDGFSVSFSLRQRQQHELGEALVTYPAQDISQLVN